MERNHSIDYLELPAADLAAVRAFYETVFGWHFSEFGEDYMSFRHGDCRGGFYRAEARSSTAGGAALPVIFARDLEAAEAAVTAAGGSICRETFAFPGGRRFHFTDPNGNELAVWSDR